MDLSMRKAWLHRSLVASPTTLLNSERPRFPELWSTQSAYSDQLGLKEQIEQGPLMLPLLVKDQMLHKRFIDENWWVLYMIELLVTVFFFNQFWSICGMVVQYFVDLNNTRNESEPVSKRLKYPSLPASICQSLPPWWSKRSKEEGSMPAQRRSEDLEWIPVRIYRFEMCKSLPDLESTFRCKIMLSSLLQHVITRMPPIDSRVTKIKEKSSFLERLNHHHLSKGKRMCVHCTDNSNLKMGTKIKSSGDNNMPNLFFC